MENMTVDGTYEGGDKFAAAHATANVDFGVRPAPSLPSQGVLITPYATAWIGIPFLMFFGMIWSVFLYVGVYLLFIRLPQVRKEQLIEQRSRPRPGLPGSCCCAAAAAEADPEAAKRLVRDSRPERGAALPSGS